VKLGQTMIKLSQRDNRWSFKTIGNTKVTIGAMGCTITCLSMASDWFGCYHDPDWMAKNLSFTNDAKVYWSSIDRQTCFKFEWRFYKYEESRILEAIKNPNKVCLLNVYNKHWVLAVKKIIGGFWVVDPWTGGNKFYATGSISGGAILKK